MNKNSIYFAFGLYGVAGIQLAASVIAGLFIGQWVDGKLGISPVLTFAGCLLGTAGGLWNLVRIVGWYGEKGNRGD